MDLIIHHRKIITPIIEILKEVRNQSNSGYLKDIQNKNQNVLCTCPFHKEGHESKPACNVFNVLDDPEVEYGTYYCFACGSTGKLSKLVGKCFDQPEETQEEFGEEWLVENFGATFVDEIEYLPEIDLSKPKKFKLNENILYNYEYNNENALNYLINKRHLKKEVIDYFKIGFNKETNSVTFPCWDEKNDLVGIFERSIYTKHFHIPEIQPKPIYLLNEIIKQNYTLVYVVESQINCLTLWSWGIPSIALFGTGTNEQYKMLRKSGIRNFILVFDGDDAGRRGRDKFIKNMSYDKLISYINVPEGMDVNDLSYDQFISLPMYNI